MKTKFTTYGGLGQGQGYILCEREGEIASDCPGGGGGGWGGDNAHYTHNRTYMHIAIGQRKPPRVSPHGPNKLVVYTYIYKYIYIIYLYTCLNLSADQENVKPWCGR